MQGHIVEGGVGIERAATSDGENTTLQSQRHGRTDTGGIKVAQGVEATVIPVQGGEVHRHRGGAGKRSGVAQGQRVGPHNRRPRVGVRVGQGHGGLVGVSKVPRQAATENGGVSSSGQCHRRA